MDKTLMIHGDQGRTVFDYVDGTATVVDASEASWILSNTGAYSNPYPVKVYDATSGLRLIGGEIDGQISQIADWRDAYINSAGVLLKRSRDITIEDWRIKDAWDAIRIGEKSDGFDISNVWLSGIRDDAVENDYMHGGKIEDSLFDGVFVGVSAMTRARIDGSDETVDIDGLLMRMETYLYKGEVTHGLPFKVDEDSPDMVINDSVVAIEDVKHIGYGRTDEMWDKVVGGTNNYFLNLSNEDLPRWYTLPGAGWTVLEGQEARDYWEAARSGWIESRTGESGKDVASDKRVVADPGKSVIKGTAENDRLRGTGEDDVIRGGRGDDWLRGKEGQDTLFGGRGADTFVFDATSDMGVNYDEIRDFRVGLDRIALRPNVFEALADTGRDLDADLFEVFSDGTSDAVISYNSSTGAVFYDADGSGRGEPWHFAQLKTGLDLSTEDFVIF